MPSTDAKMCPSHRCKPGSQLLGVRQDDGTVAILPQTLPVDEAFVAKAKLHPLSPEQRFRFANKCIESGCSQWTGKGCGVVEKVLNYLHHLPPGREGMIDCSLRANCRWFAQEGQTACKICTIVITEVTTDDVSPATA